MVRTNFTRTVNPLQFEALEPKRFEDLVRQLIYELRPWRQLEPTGRLGADDGFDVRGWEVRKNAIADAADDEAEAEAGPGAGDLIWLVQCKREREIGPTKLLGYLDAISAADSASLHGIIVAACADFSKRSRDVFREWCVGRGIAEFHLWGKAELEDALFQPKNDGLLFAYFGLSLTIRTRSEQARLRSQTTIKRKLKRALDTRHEVLLRDLNDEDYPYRKTGDEEFGWWVFERPKLTFRGLECIARRYFAYVDDDGAHWDCANALDDGRAGSQADPWRGHRGPTDERQELFAFWDALPANNKGWLDVWGVLPFNSIIEVDDVGDDITDHPHVYVTASSGAGRPFADHHAEISRTDRWSENIPDPNPANRILKFPPKFRKPLPRRTPDGAEQEPAGVKGR